jgi:hypothetical protein
VTFIPGSEIAHYQSDPRTRRACGTKTQAPHRLHFRRLTARPECFRYATLSAPFAISDFGVFLESSAAFVVKFLFSFVASATFAVQLYVLSACIGVNRRQQRW